MQIKLDLRLQAVATMVLPGETMADIGSDHAYLPAHLLQTGVCPQAVAVEKAKGPYHSARRLAEVLFGERLSVRLGDGLQPLLPDEAATIVLAGMGGCLIRDILDRSPQVLAQTRRLVLQPQRNPEACRIWLAENGWRIFTEQVVADEEQYYFVFAAEPGAMALSAAELHYGQLKLQQSPANLAAYLRQHRAELAELQRQLVAAQSAPAIRRRQQVEAELQQIDNVLENLSK